MVISPHFSFFLVSHQVRKTYNTLVFELNNAELVNTLGRATVSICDELMKHKIPTDDPETLCVFLVVFGMHKWIGHLKNPGLRCLEVKNSWEHHRTIDG